MGPQGYARVLYADHGPPDGGFWSLHHIRRAVPIRDGYLAVLPGSVLLRSAADVPRAHGRFRQRPRIPRRGVWHVELDRRDRGGALSSHQRRAAGHEGELEYGGVFGSRQHPRRDL